MNSKQQLVFISFIVIVLLMGSMAISGCESGQLFTLTPTPTQTQTMMPTSTNTPTRTSTVTSTPDPAVTLQIQYQKYLLLYPGPDSNLTPHLRLEGGTRILLLGKIARNSPFGCGTWYKIQIEESQEVGWLPCQFNTHDFDDREILELQNVEIPLTNTPAPTPALPRTVHITLVNQTEYAVEAHFRGPYVINVTIQPGKTKMVNLPAGSYYYELKSPGFVPKSGNVNWPEDYIDTWNITLK